MPSTGTPSVEHLLRRARRPASVVDSGPPERMMPRGRSRDLGGIVVPGPDLAVDADLAHAARDQLGVLRAEIEDQDLVAVWMIRWMGQSHRIVYSTVHCTHLLQNDRDNDSGLLPIPFSPFPLFYQRQWLSPAGRRRQHASARLRAFLGSAHPRPWREPLPRGRARAQAPIRDSHSPLRVVRRFLGDLHVVHVDSRTPALVMRTNLGLVRISSMVAQPHSPSRRAGRRQLVHDDIAQRAAIRHAALDAFRHQLVGVDASWK
jgi:hypothetical protein